MQEKALHISIEQQLFCYECDSRVLNVIPDIYEPIQGIARPPL